MSRFNELRHGDLGEVGAIVDREELDEGEVRVVLLNLVDRIDGLVQSRQNFEDRLLDLRKDFLEATEEYDRRQAEHGENDSRLGRRIAALEGDRRRPELTGEDGPYRYLRARNCANGPVGDVTFPASVDELVRILNEAYRRGVASGEDLDR